MKSKFKKQTQKIKRSNQMIKKVLTDKDNNKF